MGFYIRNDRPPLGLKTPALVSHAARQNARGKECTLQIPHVCNHDVETTVLCHLRFFGWAGVAQKPDDYLAVFCCGACHAALDDRSRWPSIGLGYDDLLRALGSTLQQQFHDGVFKA